MATACKVRGDREAYIFKVGSPDQALDDISWLGYTWQVFNEITLLYSSSENFILLFQIYSIFQ